MKTGVYRGSRSSKIAPAGRVRIRRPRWVVALCAGWIACCACSTAATAESESKLLTVLRARAQADTSFQADVRHTVRGGADRRQYAADFKQYLQWLRKSGEREAAAEGEKNLATIEAEAVTKVRYYRYRSQGYRFYAEEYGGSPPGTAGVKPVLSAYTGDRWQVLAPPSRLPGNPPEPQMRIYADDRGSVPKMEVARGMAVSFIAQMKRAFELSARARATGQLRWEEFFKVEMDPAMTRESILPHPQTKAALPVLALSGAPFKDSGMGRYRIRLWFDPKHSYCPVWMECCNLEPDPANGGFFFLVDQTAEWSAPITLPDGGVFAARCTLKYYHRFAPPIEGKPIEEWLGKGYEAVVHEFEFSNVRVNEPLDPAQFVIKPPPGANVVDEMAGYRYLAGSAGAELGKSALALRAQLPDPVAPKRWSPWRVILVVAIVVLLGVIGGGAWYRLRRRAR